MQSLCMIERVNDMCYPRIYESIEFHAFVVAEKGHALLAANPNPYVLPVAPAYPFLSRYLCLSLQVMNSLIMRCV